MIRGFKRSVAAMGLAAVLGAAGFAGSMAFAAKAESLTPEQITEVTAVTEYFNKLKTMQGDFTQVGPKGHISKGSFVISKPGRMRFEYAKPNPFLVISDGTWVTIRNSVKNRNDQYPLSATPLRLVLADDVDLLKEAKILKVEATPEGQTMLTLEDKDQLMPGHLVLVYDKAKEELQQWVIVDGQGRKTTISLNNVVAGVAPDPALFKVEIKREDARSTR